MALKLRQSSFEFAKELIEAGKTVLDERDDWSERGGVASGPVQVRRRRASG